MRRVCVSCSRSIERQFVITPPKGKALYVSDVLLHRTCALAERPELRPHQMYNRDWLNVIFLIRHLAHPIHIFTRGQKVRNMTSIFGLSSTLCSLRVETQRHYLKSKTVIGPRPLQLWYSSVTGEIGTLK